jgi:hypothetical protein
MADGSLKPIEEINAGDWVLSFDTETKAFVRDKVKKTSRHEAEKYLIINSHLKVTPNHQFYSNGKWIEIGNLKIGDILLNSQGKAERIFAIKEAKEKVAVFDIEVNFTHNYFAAGFLVHNKRGPSRPRSELRRNIFEAIAFAQGSSFTPPDISGYPALPAFAGTANNYDVKVIANDAEAAYFLSDTGPGPTPYIVQIYLLMSKTIFGNEEINFSLPSEVRLRNISM